jgi:hypothetical protein
MAVKQAKQNQNSVGSKAQGFTPNPFGGASQGVYDPFGGYTLNPNLPADPNTNPTYPDLVGQVGEVQAWAKFSNLYPRLAISAIQGGKAPAAATGASVEASAPVSSTAPVSPTVTAGTTAAGTPVQQPVAQSSTPGVVPATNEYPAFFPTPEWLSAMKKFGYEEYMWPNLSPFERQAIMIVKDDPSQAVALKEAILNKLMGNKVITQAEKDAQMMAFRSKELKLAADESKAQGVPYNLGLPEDRLRLLRDKWYPNWNPNTQPVPNQRAQDFLDGKEVSGFPTPSGTWLLKPNLEVVPLNETPGAEGGAPAVQSTYNMQTAAGRMRYITDTYNRTPEEVKANPGVSSWVQTGLDKANIGLPDVAKVKKETQIEEYRTGPLQAWVARAVEAVGPPPQPPATGKGSSTRMQRSASGGVATQPRGDSSVQSVPGTPSRYEMPPLAPPASTVTRRVVKLDIYGKPMPGTEQDWNPMVARQPWLWQETEPMTVTVPIAVPSQAARYVKLDMFGQPIPGSEQDYNPIIASKPDLWRQVSAGASTATMSGQDINPTMPTWARGNYVPGTAPTTRVVPSLSPALTYVPEHDVWNQVPAAATPPAFDYIPSYRQSQQQYAPSIYTPPSTWTVNVRTAAQQAEEDALSRLEGTPIVPTGSVAAFGRVNPAQYTATGNTQQQAMDAARAWVQAAQARQAQAQAAYTPPPSLTQAGGFTGGGFSGGGGGGGSGPNAFDWAQLAQQKALAEAQAQLQRDLQAQQLAQQRMLAAQQLGQAVAQMQQQGWETALPWQTPKRTLYTPGLGPGGPVAGMASLAGAQFSPQLAVVSEPPSTGEIMKWIQQAVGKFGG